MEIRDSAGGGGTINHMEDSGGMSSVVSRAQQEFGSETVWLNSASMGLPPRRTVTALRTAIDDWEAGRADAVGYDAPLNRARQLYAGLVGVGLGQVAVGSQASVLVGLVAASLPPGSEVLTVAGEFTSVTFPFHARVAAGHDITVREVPLQSLPEEVRTSTTWVAVSAVQSADGQLVETDALSEACRRTGTRVLLDTTQAVGWLPVDAGRWAVTVCGGYKWLLNPRGTAFLTVTPDLLDVLVPTSASWYAGEDPWTSIYGSPLRLAADARRFDVSPAWHSWVGAAPSLELLTEVGTTVLHQHSVGLARRFCAGVGLPIGRSAIVSCAVSDAGRAAMAGARIVGATRAGRLRLAFHISTTSTDVDRAVAALKGCVHH